MENVSLQEVKFEGWPHIVRSQQFSKEWIERVLFPLTDKMERLSPHSLRTLLTDKEMISLFVAESTRTRASFEIAMKRLGGRVVFGSEAAGKFSSMAKGESIEDTMTVFNEFGADVIILRDSEEGGAERAAAVSSIPVINAGDGRGQHPTQALLDLCTIQKHMNRIAGLKVALIGDVEGSRTIHSLAYLLGKYPDITIYFVAPSHMKIRPDIMEYLRGHGVKVIGVQDIRDVASEADVFYQTRTQTNLGTTAWNRNDGSNGLTVINKEVLAMAKPDSIILHPLPCTDEIIRAEVDPDPRAVYIQTKAGRMSQVRCGLFVRKALLLLVISPQSCVRLLTF